MIDQLPAGSRVVVAMSGGVDSSTVAGMLARAGHEVIGITLQLYDHGAVRGRPGSCCAGQDVHDARSVAERLGIAHYVIDAEERFRRAVIDDFAAEYAAGRTPVPCARCNQRVKFQDLLGIAKDLGAAALATGHYARRREGSSGAELWRARDPAKDQSYFLFATTAGQLDYLRFPLGELTKTETRALAAELELPVAAKPDSQDICFVPTGHYSDLVARLRPDAMASGDIVDDAGRVLGRHAGTARFTVGQRRGLSVAAADPLYVIRIDAGARRIVVGPRRAAEVAACSLSETNWLVAPPEAEVSIQHRFRDRPTPARIAGNRVIFGQPQSGVAPGQACVAYDGERLLGGGWIGGTEAAAALDTLGAAA